MANFNITLDFPPLTSKLYDKLHNQIQAQYDKALLGGRACPPRVDDARTFNVNPEPPVGTLAWVRSIAGEDAEVTEDPRIGRVTVVLPAGTTAERCVEVHDILRTQGAMAVDYYVRARRPNLPAPPRATVTVQLPGYVDKIEATIGIAESEETGVVCKACGAKERRQKHGPIATTMLHLDDCRMVREAPLVALVSQVPEGLDATGWRAAVAALAENRGYGRMLPDGVAAFFMTKGNGIVQHIRAGTVPAAHEQTGVHTVVAAYRRAVTPHKAPAPERKGATWKTRGTIYTQHADEA